MKFCRRCGQKLQDNANFCTGCGSKQPKAMKMPLRPAFSTAQSSYSPTECTALVPVGEQFKEKSALPGLIWSLILVIFFNPIGTPLSIAAAVLSVIANADKNRNTRARKLQISIVLCIAATAIDVLSYILLIRAAIPFLVSPHGIGL